MTEAVHSATETNQNPYGNLPMVGQFAEARGFLRMYGGNPYAQQQLLETLVGLHATLREGIVARPVEGDIDFTVATEGLKAVIAHIDQTLPEWRIDGFKLDSDWGMPPYKTSELLTRQVDAILNPSEPHEA